jgi:hypothetical protein
MFRLYGWHCWWLLQGGRGLDMHRLILSCLFFVFYGHVCEEGRKVVVVRLACGRCSILRIERINKRRVGSGVGRRHNSLLRGIRSRVVRRSGAWGTANGVGIGSYSGAISGIGTNAGDGIAGVELAAAEISGALSSMAGAAS